MEAALKEGDWYTIALQHGVGFAELNRMTIHTLKTNLEGEPFQAKVIVTMEKWMMKTVEENPQITLKETALMILESSQ